MTTCPHDRALRGFNPVAAVALALVLAILFLADAEFSTAGDATIVVTAMTRPKENVK